MQRGKIILVVGPTGSGKGTLVAYAQSIYPNLVPSVSCTTRLPRPGETDGEHYHFITREEFGKRIGDDDFLEWAEYGGNYYGTPRAGIEEKLAGGISVVLEIEAQGARIVRANCAPEDLITIFIDAGSWEALATRVRARAPITDEELEKRHRHYDDEMTFRSEADVVIQNRDGEIEEAKKAFVAALASVAHA